jgi:hypothetical protein
MKTILRFGLPLAVILSVLAPSTSGQVLFVAKIDGSQEVPAVPTPAKGTAWAVLSGDMTSLTYRVTYARLKGSFTQAHFHVGAPGVAGGVAQAITFVGNTASGTWTSLPDSIVRHLLKGNVYVNIHSDSVASGEIRGQLNSTIGLVAALDGSQEVPSVATGAKGTGWVQFFNADSTEYHVTIAGLEGTYSQSHFHAGPAGVIGGVVQAIAFTDSTASGTWANYPDSVLTHFTKGNIYVNVHSATHSVGEIRGQLSRVGEIVLTASLDGSQEVPAVTTPGKGTAWAVLSADFTSLKFQVTFARLKGRYSQSHFHVGPAGVVGGVAQPITFVGNTASGTWSSLPDSIVRHLLRGNVYVNIHTDSVAAGEIRGNLDVRVPLVFTANLTGDQEAPAVTTGARGTAWAGLQNSASTLEYEVTIAGLEGAYSQAHFHAGAPGVAGGVVQAITFTDSMASGTWSGFADSVLTHLTKGNIYVNVHSDAHSLGEIRGQLRIASGTPTSVEVVSHNIPKSFSLQQNFPNPFNPSTIIRFDLARRGKINLKVYNLLGQVVASLVDGIYEAGTYTVSFDSRSLSSGVYFYRLTVDGGFADTKKMLLMR